MPDTKQPYSIQNGAVVILAAGASKRLGRPKQLLPVGDITMLQHATQVAAGLGWDPVVVVVSPEQWEPTIDLMQDMNVQVIPNDACEEGMAASIRCGITYLQQQVQDCDGAMLMVCDQPRLNTETLQQLYNRQQQAEKPVAAAYYANRPGTPALIHHSWFDKLMNLHGDTGARKLFVDHADQVALFDFPDGIIDIDTPEDVHLLKQ